MSTYLCINDGTNVIKHLAASSTNSTEAYIRVDSHYFPLTTDTTAEPLLKIKGVGTSTYRMQRLHTITITTGTSYLTKSSTSNTTYLTQSSTYSTTYKTKSSTSNTTYLTQSSTYSTTYRTRSSTSVTGYLTKSSTYNTRYGTRSVYNYTDPEIATVNFAYNVNSTKRQRVSFGYDNMPAVNGVALYRVTTGSSADYYESFTLATTLPKSSSNSTNSRLYRIKFPRAVPMDALDLVDLPQVGGNLTESGWAFQFISSYVSGNIKTFYRSFFGATGTMTQTTGTTYDTRSSTYSTTYSTRSSTSATDYLTRSSTYQTSYLTKSSTYSTDYLTKSSTYSTSYLTRSSTYSTSYLTTTTTSQW